MKKLLLVDGSSYLYRAFHAMPDFRSLENDASKADVLISRQQELIGNIFHKVIQFEKNIENYEINLQVSNLFFIIILSRFCMWIFFFVFAFFKF